MSDFILDDDINSKEGGISSKTKLILTETGKWTMFLAITGFIFIGLITIAFLMSFVFGMSGSYLNAVGSGIISFFVFITILVLSLIPTIFLYNFSVNINKATSFSKTKDYENAFGYLKRNFIFIGTSSIVLISLYLLFLSYTFLGN